MCTDERGEVAQGYRGGVKVRGGQRKKVTERIERMRGEDRKRRGRKVQKAVLAPLITYVQHDIGLTLETEHSRQNQVDSFKC